MEILNSERVQGAKTIRVIKSWVELVKPIGYKYKVGDKFPVWTVSATMVEIITKGKAIDGVLQPFPIDLCDYRKENFKPCEAPQGIWQK
jgi:hypothetical protein